MAKRNGLMILSLLLVLLVFIEAISADTQEILPSSEEQRNTPLHIHEYWMRHANTLYASLTPSHTACPFNAFAAVIVNHSLSTAGDPLGRPVCTGVNGVTEWGNPTLHGEMAAINNCSRMFRGEERGVEEGLGGGEIWRDLSIYSTAEPCPMCASAIRWTGFKEVIFGTRRSTMVGMGWKLIDLETEEVFERAAMLEGETGLLGGVLANETDAYFAWQYDRDGECPRGCGRDENGRCGDLKGMMRKMVWMGRFG